LASVEGVPAVDPQQTELPGEWRQLPAYRLAPGSTMRLVEKRRGDSDPAPDRLSLHRSWWLDFDGGGFTVKDHISGTTTRTWRLEMAEPTVLGRAAVGGREQFLTRLGDRSSVGIELREGQLQLEADSRVEGAVSRVPAVGWDHDFQGVNAQLNLPPGWQLYYASGVDDVSSSWVTNWTLLDLFVVLIVAMAVGRLSSWRWGLVALATLALPYPESMAARWPWVAVCEAKSFSRPGRAGYEDRYNAYRLDPNALIPTGPGLPRWSWQTVWLSWRGPVERDQRLHLMLASPRVNRVLAFLRVALTGLLL